MQAACLGWYALEPKDFQSYFVRKAVREPVQDFVQERLLSSPQVSMRVRAG
jgi:hypothetical protein